MGKKNILVAAGGTGGHLFPAVAVIEELEKFGFNKNQIFFVGNPQKIEGRIVPSLGYNFLPLNISGLTKLLSLSTLLLPFKIINSIAKAKKYIIDNNIGLVICAGAYLSYPVGLAAFSSKIPLVLMESNVFPGKTIKLLADKAQLIALAFDESRKYFHKKNQNKIKILGNPVRIKLLNPIERHIARKNLNLDENLFTILVFGGSLGAKNINTAIEKLISNEDLNAQYIWQTGKSFQSNLSKSNVRTFEFIDDMATAYSASDLVICRAGATTISELTAIGKPSILVPYPFSANNHQEHNAIMMVKHGASIMIKDNELELKIKESILQLIQDQHLLASMSENARKLSKVNSAELTAREIINLFSVKLLK